MLASSYSLYPWPPNHVSPRVISKPAASMLPGKLARNSNLGPWSVPLNQRPRGGPSNLCLNLLSEVILTSGKGWELLPLTLANYHIWNSPKETAGELSLLKQAQECSGFLHQCWQFGGSEAIFTSVKCRGKVFSVRG